MTTGQLGTVLRYLRSLADPPARDLTDRQLLERFRAQRDQAAFTALVQRHGRLVWGVCRHLLHNDHDAEDAFQATFLVLVRQAAAVHKPEALGSWLHGVAYRVAMKAKRDAARRREHERRTSTKSPPSGSQNPVSETAWRQLQAALDEEVQALPDRLRIPFVLCCLEGRSQTDVAEQLGWKLGTVSSAVTRARKELQRQLARRDVSLSAVLCAGILSQEAAGAAVPAALAQTTVVAGLALAADPSAAVVPAHIAAWVKGVTQSMFLGKVQIATTLLVAASLVAAATGWATHDLVTPSRGFPETTAKPPAAEAKPHVPEVSSPAAVGPADAVELAGRVVGPDDKPVPGAKVYYLRRGREEDFGYGPERVRRTQQETTADAEGQFRLRVEMVPSQSTENEQLSADKAVTATAKDYGPGWVFLSKVKSLQKLTLKLVKDDVPITGRVLDLEGKPVSGVTVRVLQCTSPATESLQAWCERLRMKKEGMGAGLNSPAALEAAVRALQPVITGLDGRFRISGLGCDRIAVLRFEGPTIETRDMHALTREEATIRVARQNARPDQEELVFHGATFDYVAAPTKPIVGTVRDKDTGKPLAGVTVRGRIPSGLDMGSQNEITTLTDDAGRYRLVGLPRTPVDGVTAQPPAGQPYLPVSAKIGSSPGLEPVQLDIGLKRVLVIRGRVTDQATGQPVHAQVEYFLFADSPSRKEVPGLSPIRAYTTADGSFELPGLPGRGLLAAKVPRSEWGRYIAGAGAEEIKGANNQGLFITYPNGCIPDRFNTLVEINPAPDAKLFTCNLGLDPGRTISGTIVGPDGKPVEGGWVESWGPQLRPRQRLPTAQFTLTAINPKNPRAFFFYHGGNNLAAAVLLLGDEPKDFMVRLEPCATLSGRLVNEDGEPLAGVSVVGIIEQGQLGFRLGHAWYGFCAEQTDQEGRFRSDGLIAGIKLSAAVEKGGRLTARVFENLTLKPGETRDLGDIQPKPFE